MAAVSVVPEQEMVLITNKATLVRARISEVSVVGRNTQGVKLINVTKGEQVVGLAVVDIEEIIEQDGDDTENTDISASSETGGVETPLEAKIETKIETKNEHDESDKEG